MAKSKEKKSGGNEKFSSQAMPKVGGSDIRTAAKSLAEPRSYEKGGYPPYPSVLHINRDVTKGTRKKGED